jgi:hypothetical protein
LSARSFLLDGEAIVTNERGLAVFDLIRHQRQGNDAVLIAFDLIELDGEDLRRTPIELRKRTLAKLVRRPHAGIVLNEVFEGDGDILFAHACKLGCEGIVSKRFGSPYRSGRFKHWIKVKNPKAPAVKREAEEDWGSKSWKAQIVSAGRENSNTHILLSTKLAAIGRTSPHSHVRRRVNSSGSFATLAAIRRARIV